MFKKVFSLERNDSKGKLTYKGKMNSTKDAIYLDKYKSIFLLITLKYVITAFYHQKEYEPGYCSGKQNHTYSIIYH